MRQLNISLHSDDDRRLIDEAAEWSGLRATEFSRLALIERARAIVESKHLALAATRPAQVGAHS